MSALQGADLQLLVARRNRVLNRLQTLSEAPASRALQGRAKTPVRTVPPAPASKLPPGIRSSLEPKSGPPDKDRSLFDFYRWHFERTKEIAEIVKLCFLAEKDLDRYSHQGEPTTERHRQRNKSILSSKYRDQPPAVVAACEDCTSAHVQTLRKRNGLNPTTGRIL